jgi:DNA-binding NarL/FixJ family response regulator
VSGLSGGLCVLVIDDERPALDEISFLLEHDDRVAEVHATDSPTEALRLLKEREIDAVFLDIQMPGLDGIEATRRIVADGGRSRILMLTTFDLDEYVHAALRAGASGFLLKDAYPAELLAGIRAVAAGDAVIAPVLTRRLLDAFAHHLGGAPGDGQPSADPRLAALTEREREILIVIGRGWTNGEIAERLVLSESTVKTHVGRVLAKIGARDRIQAVIFAYDLGLTRPYSPG